MKKIILLKLGGSLITDKTKPFTLAVDNIKFIAKEIQDALKKDVTIQLIIGTGTGSFGHYPVKKFTIEKGSKTELQKYGFCSVHQSAQKLNQIVTGELLKHKIKAFSLHPSSMMIAENGVIEDFYYRPVIDMVKTGIIPVVHGDMIYDTKQGSMICSVERLFRELIMKLHNTCRFTMIYAGSTDGVLDTKKKIIPIITSRNFGSKKSHFFDVEGYDVTGGMKTKVEECLSMTKFGVTSFIINGARKHRIEKAIIRKATEGTKIIDEES